jgi:DNA-binding transcriptional LysR family regulator
VPAKYIFHRIQLMNREELLEALQSLHKELEAGQELDEETRRMLQTVTNDIHDVLDQKASPPDDDSTNNAENTVSDRLRETLIEFEARYPQIGGLLERLTNGLSNMGI